LPGFWNENELCTLAGTADNTYWTSDLGNRIQGDKSWHDTESTQQIVEERVRLRNKAKQIAIDIEGVEVLDEEDQELINV
jgi:hypothetical protein